MPLATPSIYLDHAAATPLDPRVLSAMQPYLTTVYGNPSSRHRFGRDARRGLDAARAAAAEVLGVAPAEILFTGNGTESVATALTGVMRSRRARGKHIVTTMVEHVSVLHTCQQLEQEGCEVSYVPVDRWGRVDPAAVVVALRPDTALVSVMYANNEIGTVQPVAEIARAVHATNPAILVHTDACQAAGALPLSIGALGVDLLSINGSKIYGPKGTGLLYIRAGVVLAPLLFGGAQENNRRAGTENVAGWVGLAEALRLAEELRPAESARLAILRDQFIADLQRILPDAHLTGHSTNRLPNNIHFTIPNVDSDSLILALDAAGIAASSGSACDARTGEQSHVLTALGFSATQPYGTVRFTLGRGTSAADLAYVRDTLPSLVADLRRL